MYALDTPRGERTMRSVSGLDLPSMEQSFRSPGEDKGLLQTLQNRRGGQRSASIATPSARPTGNREFTPLLKSVQVQKLRSKLAQQREEEEDTFHSGGSGSGSGDVTQTRGLDDGSSVMSTPRIRPAARRGKEAAGDDVLRTEGQMLTLR